MAETSVPWWNLRVLLLDAMVIVVYKCAVAGKEYLVRLALLVLTTYRQDTTIYYLILYTF